MNNLSILHLEQGASLGWDCVVHPGSMLHILAASSIVPSCRELGGEGEDGCALLPSWGPVSPIGSALQPWTLARCGVTSSRGYNLLPALFPLVLAGPQSP